MEIINCSTEFKIEENTVVTIGKFDGLHKGHQLILDRMKEYQKMGYRTCVMTFDVPPANLGFGADGQVLMTLYEKQQVLRSYGMDYAVVFPFNKETAAMDARSFIENYVVNYMNAKAVVVGEDCTFGKDASGNAIMLRDMGALYGYDAVVLNKLYDGDREISSTYIREILRAGDMKRVEELSYRPYFISGMLKKDNSVSHASIEYYCMQISDEKMLPEDGTYYTRVLYEESFYPSLSFVSNERRVVETHIYGGLKGIEKECVSVVFFDKMNEKQEDIENLTIKERIKEVIFEGSKWHKEHLC